MSPWASAAVLAGLVALMFGAIGLNHWLGLRIWRQIARRDGKRLVGRQIPITRGFHELRVGPGPEGIVCEGRYPVSAGPVFSLATERFRVSRNAPKPDFAFHKAYGYSTDPDRARAVLSAELETMLREIGAYRISCDGDRVMLSCKAFVTPDLDYQLAVNAVEEIVSADIFGYGALCALPGAEPIDAASVKLALPEPVVLGAGRDGRGAATYVSAHAARALPEFHVSVSDVTVDELPDAVPTAALREHVDALRGGEIECDDGEISYWFSAIETDPKRLMAAARVVASLSQSQRDGVYR